MTKNIVGIDLGTSFSSIALLTPKGTAQILSNAEGSEVTPSAVYTGPNGILVGEAALNAELEEPGHLIQHAKRCIGDKTTAWKRNGSLITPVDAASFILKKLKEDAEGQIGPIDQAVITVPAHFGAYQRRLTIEAGKRAGLHVLDLVNEPVAAALTYIMGDLGLAYTSLADEQLIIVYDLGGGTFDLSLIHYDNSDIHVLAAGGALALGGIDWNQRLLDRVSHLFEIDHGIDPRKSPHSLSELTKTVEECKRQLSVPTSPRIGIQIRHSGLKEVYPVTRDDFEGMTSDLVQKTDKLTGELLKTAGTYWHKVDTLLAVGGATRMPMIQKMIGMMARRFESRHYAAQSRLSPELAVVEGSALYAGLLLEESNGMEIDGHRQKRLPKSYCQESIGLVVLGPDSRLANQILIHRQDPLPATAVVRVATSHANQTRVSLKLVKGESQTIYRHSVFCRCIIDNLPPDLPYGSLIDVEVTLKSNGLISITAKHKESGRLAHTIISYDG